MFAQHFRSFSLISVCYIVEPPRHTIYRLDKNKSHTVLIRPEHAKGCPVISCICVKYMIVLVRKRTSISSGAGEDDPGHADSPQHSAQSFEARIVVCCPLGPFGQHVAKVVVRQVHQRQPYCCCHHPAQYPGHLEWMWETSNTAKRRTQQSGAFKQLPSEQQRNLNTRLVGLESDRPGVRFSLNSSHTSDLAVGTPVAMLPNAWCYRISAGTGWLVSVY